MPKCRRTSTAAHAQNPRCSSRVRSRRFPVPGSSAQTRALPLPDITERRRVCPLAVKSWPGLVLPGAEDADEDVADDADVKAPPGMSRRGLRRQGVAVIGEVSPWSFVEELVDGGPGRGLVDDCLLRGE